VSARTDVAVVHLVRAANDLQAFETFMASYEEYEPGAGHQLVLLLKGFGDDDDALSSVRARAAAHEPAEVRVGDEGLDVSAYVAAAQRLDHPRLCFVNSFSEILAPGWLGLLDAPVAAGSAGAAGATASWGSSLAFGMWQSGFAGGYAEVFESRRATRRVMHEIGGAKFRSDLLFVVDNSVRVALLAPRAALFPSMHLRTNAFLVDRRLFLSLRTGRLTSKNATYRLENGRDNMTSQLRTRGRPAMLVDRHGSVREGRHWPAADVFWQARQQDLLVADNQTRAYAEGPPSHRETLSRFAWGPLARPGLGPI
jgi:hypothetical protein